MARLNFSDTEGLIKEVLRRLRSVPGFTGGGGPATQIVETSGPTTLDIVAITDGQFLKRVGTDIVSATPPTAAALPGSFARPFAIMGA